MPDTLRTLGIVAHIDAGKTTLTERILVSSGLRRFAGQVDDGTATSDWMRQEQERGISIVAAAVRVPWGACRLQVVDTPGHVDFTAEVARTLRVLDGVVVVLDGVRGVESQTESIWRKADQWRCARIAFVNKLDRPGADFEAAVAALTQSFGCLAVPVAIPLRAADGSFAGLGLPVGGEVVWFDGDVPASRLAALRALLQRAREAVVELLAEVDDTVMEAFVAGRGVAAEVLHASIRRACARGLVVPVLAGAALHGRGVEELLDAICAYLPSPMDRAREGLEEAFPPADPNAPMRSLVFKVENDGDEVRNYVRVFSGRLHVGDRVLGLRTGLAFDVQELWSMLAAEHERTRVAEPGEIAVLPGRLGLRTGDTLAASSASAPLPLPTFPAPVVIARFEPLVEADRTPLLTALAELCDDDPTLVVEVEAESGLPLVAGMGELHLEIAADRVRERLGTDLAVGRPRVALRASVRRAASAEASVVEPGSGVTATAVVEVDPWLEELPLVEVEERIEVSPEVPLADLLISELATALGSAPYRVRLRLRALRCPAGGIESLGMQALRVAMAKAVADAGALLFEPVVDVEVSAPAESLSVVLDDLSLRGADVRLVSSGQLGARIEAKGRLLAFLGYTTRLRSLTRGRAEAVLSLAGYEAIPGEDGPIAAKI